MERFFEALANPGSWTSTQWLALAIGAFLLIACFYLLYRLVAILRGLGKSTYTPNIGRARLRQQREERERETRR